jgi:hypothetical protein
MEQYADVAIQELKESGQWDGYEDHISLVCDQAPKKSPSRALLLIILRGESPEIIPIKLELKSSKRSKTKAYVEDIKGQILSYFASSTHRLGEFPKAFTIKEALDHYPDIRDWFFQTHDEKSTRGTD